MFADRCSTCDRDSTQCYRLSLVAARCSTWDRRWPDAIKECDAHRVDWRARATAASRIGAISNELADDLATAQAEIDRAAANPGGMGATLPSESRLRHGATPTVRAWLGRLVEELRGGVALAPVATTPGDPVLHAIAELLSCTYLSAVPTPADDERRRDLAVAARIANDELRAKLGEGPSTPSVRRDAAKWRRVEPLIEVLHRAALTGSSHTELIAAVADVTAAAKEPS